ncbi:glycosyltransferase family 4 protein [Butyrivibrio sp. INlla16]|uniref:glycosyltransferase family 4 protein n=1 Tax=Butyrivibrio sp. INlla16 TaxID=1520807 RepID=UPI000883864C|nr:glycosyltransferase family 4 protein [Butyrivibrio sp. INlla16]SDB18901.1 Glycosyltransferase involved in cell wall bisynthesis [Butyrivibrio sp. INlla16]
MHGDKKKVCFVIQRYGKEVNGGAETLCRELAERLTDKYEVEVLTTKAIDYMTWKDEYSSDEEEICGVKVRRFSVSRLRHRKPFNLINRIFKEGLLPTFMENRWLISQGPVVPGLIDFIKEHKDDYRAFVFMTYLYYPTVKGLPEVAEKSVFLPLAHDEPFLRMKMFEPIFTKTKAFFFETQEERDLVFKKFKCDHIPYKFGGSGVEVPDKVCGDDFKKKYELENYIIYAGRIDDGKNCKELFEFFLKYKETHSDDLKLVLIGKAVIDIPEALDIVPLGFVSEQDKFDGMAGAKLLVLPSKFESLSIVVLEAFSLGKPVLVNGECEVLKGHCDKSGGGLYYTDYEGFEKGLTTLLSDPSLREEMGEKGKSYVNERFNWKVICDNLSEMIEYASEN